MDNFNIDILNLISSNLDEKYILNLSITSRSIYMQYITFKINKLILKLSLLNDILNVRLKMKQIYSNSNVTTINVVLGTRSSVQKISFDNLIKKSKHDINTCNNYINQFSSML